MFFNVVTKLPHSPPVEMEAYKKTVFCAPVSISTDPSGKLVSHRRLGFGNCPPKFPKWKSHASISLGFSKGKPAKADPQETLYFIFWAPGAIQFMVNQD